MVTYFDVSKVLPKMIKRFGDREIKKITWFVNEGCTVKITRIGKHGRSALQEEFKLTIGKPNYEERALIKTRLSYGLDFPDIKIKYYPKKYKKPFKQGNTAV